MLLPSTWLSARKRCATCEKVNNKVNSRFLQNASCSCHVLSYRDTKPVELDGRYEGGTSGFDIHEFGILLARKFHEVFLGNKNLTRDLGNIKEFGMFVEKYFYGTREESLPFYRLFCITWRPLVFSDNWYGSVPGIIRSHFKIERFPLGFHFCLHSQLRIETSLPCPGLFSGVSSRILGLGA